MTLSSPDAEISLGLPAPVGDECIESGRSAKSPPLHTHGQPNRGVVPQAAGIVSAHTLDGATVV